MGKKKKKKKLALHFFRLYFTDCSGGVEVIIIR